MRYRAAARPARAVTALKRARPTVPTEVSGLWGLAGDGEMPRRKRKSAERREPVVDTPPRRAARADSDNVGGDETAPRKRTRSRPPLRRVFYWCAVLGLWALIMCGGAIVWVAANLPP